MLWNRRRCDREAAPDRLAARSRHPVARRAVPGREVGMTARNPIAARTLAVRGAGTFLIGVAVNLALGWIALTGGLVASTEFFRYPPIVVWTLLGTIGAAVIYGALTRFSATPDRTFVRVAVAALVLSFVPDVGLLVAVEGVTTSEAVALMALHVPPAITAMIALPNTPFGR
ncbi:hypothetical protein Z052_08110 [Halorubrum sp. C191]|nr:hypothetical protein DJ77_07270 [Halorubrum ezzemoulense]OYR81628.1 hypothetical protein DJ84_12345 [Halorubrum ezzemoulense]PHQ42625.1 hypothetical protein Z052_08110 [Halorubrum sp. C191]